jgi:hypothetical protein
MSEEEEGEEFEYYLVENGLGISHVLRRPKGTVDPSIRCVGCDCNLHSGKASKRGKPASIPERCETIRQPNPGGISPISFSIAAPFSVIMPSKNE